MHPLVLFALLAMNSLATSAGAADVAGYEFKVLHQSTQSWDGADLPDYPQGPAQITIVKLTVQPGASLPEHLHPAINGGILLTGELTVQTEHGAQRVLRAGEPILEVVNTWHAGRNSGGEVAEAIVFYVGTPGLVLTQRREPAAD